MKLLPGLMMTLFLSTAAVAQDNPHQISGWMAFGLMGILTNGQSQLLHSETTWKTQGECQDFLKSWMAAQMHEFTEKEIDPKNVMLDGRCLDMGEEGNPA